MATTTSKPGVAALSVYKKVAIIRKADDVLNYEDSEGNIKTVTDLHLAAVATVSQCVPPNKVHGYEKGLDTTDLKFSFY